MLETTIGDRGTTMTRIRGTVKRTFPNKGYLWLSGEDGVDYFGHQSHIQDGIDIMETWIGQPCSFVPNAGTGPTEKGPYAEEILLEQRAQ
jgi:cold shock CspA family protein